MPLDEEQLGCDDRGDAWFKRRSFGYGWTPASWEGWAVTLVWTAISGAGVIWLLGHLPLWIVPWVGASCVVLLFVIVMKNLDRLRVDPRAADLVTVFETSDGAHPVRVTDEQLLVLRDVVTRWVDEVGPSRLPPGITRLRGALDQHVRDVRRRDAQDSSAPPRRGRSG